MFLNEHNETMKYVEKLLYFLSAADVGLLSFANLDGAAGLFVTFSLLFLFFAYAFWILYSNFESSNIQYFGAYESAPDDHAVHRLTDFYDRESQQAAKTLIVLIVASAMTLFGGLMDQFISESLIPTAPASLAIAAFIICSLALLVRWIFGYRAAGKSLDDFV